MQRVCFFASFCVHSSHGESITGTDWGTRSFSHSKIKIVNRFSMNTFRTTSATSVDRPAAYRVNQNLKNGKAERARLSIGASDRKVLKNQLAFTWISSANKCFAASNFV